MSDPREILAGYWKAPAIIAAARLGIADQLSDARSADELARTMRVDPFSLTRLLRSLAALGLVEQRDDDVFALTESGASLRSDDRNGVAGRARHIGEVLLPAYLHLAQCVQSGTPPPDIKHGSGGFAELIGNPDEARLFNQMMADTSRRIAAAAVDAYDFSRFRKVLDLGGGYGGVLAALLKRYGHLEGTVLDLAHARSGAEALFEAEGVAGRARFVEGNFFERIDTDADCLILKYILHDWPDEDAALIMAKVGEAAASNGGTVIVIERIVPPRIAPSDEHCSFVYSDLTMMLWGGRERTEAEYRGLFADAGLSLTRTIPLGDGHFIIEGRP